jgi:hypothetical protein
VSYSFFKRFCLIRFCAFGILAIVIPQLHADRWQVQYIYESAKSDLVLQDVQFPSPARGIAIGEIVEGRNRKGVAVVTSDGGAHWNVVKLEENPISLFFLNDSLGWMVTEKGLWKTNEAGKDWQKLPKLPNQPWRVYFADENNGWAACTKKTGASGRRLAGSGSARAIGLLVDRVRRQELRTDHGLQPAIDAVGRSVSTGIGPGGCVEPPGDAAPCVSDVDA